MYSGNRLAFQPVPAPHQAAQDKNCGNTKEQRMSSIGMLGADILESLVSSTRHGSSQKFKQDFQQLGQDLQSGNVTRGQADLTALQSDISSASTPSSSSSSSSSASPVTSQAFSQIAQDLQSGNLTAAQSDYANLQQGLKQGAGHGHHHFHSAAASSGLTQAQDALAQLGQALQSGNLSAAQQAYTTFQADTAAFAPFAGSSSTGASSTGTGLNIAV
jgi:hypothetical protein